MAVVHGVADRGLVSDRALVSRSRRGDTDAFARLYDRYRLALYQVCLRRLRDPNLAEDVVHETFERALNHLGSFDQSRRMFPWLATIAQNACVDILRTRSRTSLLDDLESSDSTESAQFLPVAEDTTVEAVISSEERRRLGEALSMLPPRQRRVLLLYALENWSYAEIATAEQSSVSSVKSVIHRARDNLRRICDRGLLGIAWGPLLYVRLRVRRGVNRFEAAFAGLTNGGMFAAGAIASPALGIVLALTALTPAAITQHTALAQPIAHGALSSETASTAVPERPAPPNKTETLADFNPVKHVNDSFLGGSDKNTSPEQTQVSSFAVSPSYDQDHTVFASGNAACATPMCSSLFVSRNGGATWRRLAAKDFTGVQIMLPPTFPADSRIFAIGPTGLQVSEDNGASFMTISNVTGRAAMSPDFQHDRLIFIATPLGVLEYRDDIKQVVPASFTAATPNPTISFAPGYAYNRQVSIGSMHPDTTQGAYGAVIHFCTNALCRSRDLPAQGSPTVHFSPRFAQDGTVYAHTPTQLFVSRAGSMEFESVSLPALTGPIVKMVVDNEAIYLTVSKTKGVYVSHDGGATWSRQVIKTAGFRGHVSNLTFLGSSGRLIAAGGAGGIACSDDGGRTWLSRCSAV